MNSTSKHFERLREIQEAVPDRYEDVVWELTGDGYAPRTVHAAIEYAETKQTQTQVADKFDTTENGIRPLIRELVDRRYINIDEIPVNEGPPGEYPFGTNRNDNPKNGGLRWEPDS